MIKLKTYQKLLPLLLIFMFNQWGKAQSSEADSVKFIQFSGKVVTEDEYGQIVPLPYTNVAIKGTSRGTVSEFDGFFSFVATSADTIVFSRIGYENVYYSVPDSLNSSLYYWIQIMSQDNILLPEAVIRPYPSREHFKIEFLALDITDELEQQYSEYLAAEVLEELRYVLPADGRETYGLYRKQEVEKFRYVGQAKPQNIFNPLAWRDFIQAWKRGDFKNKKKNKK